MCPRQGWCGHGGPSTGPTACALASRRCALSGWLEGFPGGGALPRCEGRLRSGAHPPPAARPQGWLSGSATHVLWAGMGRRGGLVPFLWLACPAGGCVPRGRWVAVTGDWPPTVVRGAWCQALSLSRPLVPVGRQPGPVARVSRARVACAWGTQHGPQSARSSEPALRVVAVAGGRGRGGALRRCEGRLRSGARLPQAACPTGRAVGVRCLRVVGVGVRAWRPGTVPLVCMPCGGLLAAGVVGGCPGGVASNCCEGRLVSGAVPLPDARPCAQAAWACCPCVPGTDGVGMGDPAPAPQHALLRAGVARCGGGGRASPRGGVRCAVVRGV